LTGEEKRTTARREALNNPDRKKRTFLKEEFEIISEKPKGENIAEEQGGETQQRPRRRKFPWRRELESC